MIVSRRSSRRINPSSTGFRGVSLADLAASRIARKVQATQDEAVAQVAPLVPHPPSPNQALFLASDAEELLFGGAAGGGKSDALLMAALQFVDVPGYAGAIFRRTKVEMNRPEAPLARMRQWLAPAIAAGRCEWDDKAHGFAFRTFDAKGARAPDSLIHFGYGSTLTQLETYQGAAFQFIGIDELGAWPLGFYQYLFSRLRRTVELGARRVPLRMRSTANPGGPGHEWIKDRFVSHARHARGTTALEDLRARRKRTRSLPAPPVYRSPPSAEALELAKETGRPAQGAVFIPSFTSDNPGLDVASYRAQLARLDPVRREQLEEGDWESTGSGGFFSLASFEVVDVLPELGRWIRSWDFAATKLEPGKDPDWTVGAKCGIWRPRDKDGVYGAPRFVVGDLARWRENPAEQERLVKAVAQLDGRKVSQVIEQEPGSAGKTVIHNWATGPLFGWQVLGFKKTGPKEEYWRPLSGFASQSPIILLRAPWNAALIAELTALPIGHDDQGDAVSQGYVFLTEKQDAVSRARALASR